MPAIPDSQFSSAQAAELANWSSRAEDEVFVRLELSEDSGLVEPCRRIVGSTVFERGLEVGVGSFGLGFLASHLHDHVRNIDGLDPLPQIAVKVRNRELQAEVDRIRQRVRYIQGRAEAMPFEPAGYDIVSCINVVDHAQDPAQILREIDRVLRPGGLLVFGVSTLSWLGQWLWRVRRRRKPLDWLFVAHPHTFRWPAADRLARSVPGETLWHDRPGLIESVAGHGRMSFWIRRKAS